MKLTSFKVENFRSVNDSGPIEVADRTVLVGRNESGKTNLLIALHSLNPAGGIKELSYIKDFPRDRPANKFSKEAYVVTTHWALSSDEQFKQLFPSR